MANYSSEFEQQVINDLAVIRTKVEQLVPDVAALDVRVGELEDSHNFVRGAGAVITFLYGAVLTYFGLGHQR